MKRWTTYALFLLATVGLVSAQPSSTNQQTNQKMADPYQLTLNRLESLTSLPFPDWRFHADVPHPEDSSLDDSSWETMKVGDQWSTGSRVLRRWIEIPEKIDGYAVLHTRARLDLGFDFMWNNKGPAIISVFSNGSLVSRGDDDMQQPILLTENAQPGQKFLIAVRIDAPDVDTLFQHAKLTIEPAAGRPDPAMVRTEILAARPMIAAYEEGRAERQQQLDAAVNAIDFTPLDKGDQAAFDASLRAAQAKLQSLNPWLKQFTVRAIGNSHIDMAWLWPWTETVEVVRNTFQSVLDLMREYPDLKFTMSSARTYEWMQEKYPDLFDQIKQRVKEGRWEVIGGMWVEPDLNMPDGESLVRQILVGKRYFKKNFGADIKIGWNPDSFGYNWQLPQIYKKSGIDYFVSSKLLWATDYTKFPYRLFWWQAPDGSRLLTYFPHEYANDFDPQRLTQDLSFYAPSIYGSKFNDSPQMLYLYGIGDHGGGPTRTMLDEANRLRDPNTVFPKIEFSTAKDFFADLQQELPDLKVPTWKDELYFEYHRGVLTTQADTKQRIRHDEELMLDAEKYASLASLFGRPYAHDQFELAWKNLLFDHFHDVMPGSGIAVNYLDAKRNLEDVARSAQLITDASLDELLAHVNTQGANVRGDGVAVVVFNSLSWPRTEVVEAEVQLPGSAREVLVLDGAGEPVAHQLLAMDSSTNRARLLIVANVPALGYTTYFVRAAAQAGVSHDAHTSHRSGAVSVSSSTSASTLENGSIRVTVDPHTGCITSLFDLHTQTEALAPSETDSGGPRTSACGNLLQTFTDKPKLWDAWNIDSDFEKQHWDLDKADEVKIIERGPLRAVVRVKKQFQNSNFVQDITMYAGEPRVDVKMQADWHEKHILLKVTFPLSAHSDKATFEIPYGSIERPTTRNTPAEQAKFEVPGLRWADLSSDRPADAKHGFSLLNDCKYGYDVKGNVLRLSLLRSPEWPDPHADEGRHEFTYALYAHAGTWRDAQTVRRGYELNYKLIARPSQKHSGSLPGEHSFLRIEPDNVVLTAVKKSEDDDSLILRFYEWAGKEADVKLQLPAGAQSASETDLMERPTADLAVKSNAVTVHTKPYEIKTLKVKFAQHSSVQ
ncbi:MAG TPA: glycoside hydrolase family 38 C-terminal domain-containing protein [Terriglobales bacterium]